MVENSKHIAVIGAGVMGLVAAYACVCAGHRVRLYDPCGFPAVGGASWVAGGMLAPYAEIEHMDVRWAEAGAAGIAFWRDFGADIGFAEGGSLLVAHREDAHILLRFKGHLERMTGTALQMRGVEDLEPQLAARFAQGLYLEGEAQVHPELALAALVEALRAAGVEMIAERADVEELEADYVIDCRGMASADKDLRGVKGELLIVRNAEFSLSRPVRLMHPRYPLYIVPRGGGVFMIGATQVEGEGDGVALRSAMELMSALYSLHPSFGDALILEIKSGVRPSYSDNLPRITVSGRAIRCNGMFRHGFLLSPVMAAEVVEMLAGRRGAFYELLAGGKSDEGDHQRQGKELRGAA